MPIESAKLNISDKLHKLGFIRLSGLYWLADGAEGIIGEEVDESNHSRWNSRDLSGSKRGFVQVVLVTESGEVWIYLGRKTDQVLSFLKTNFIYTEETADIPPLRFINTSKLLIRDNHPDVEFEGF
jgi:hypothetical protein